MAKKTIKTETEKSKAETTKTKAATTKAKTKTTKAKTVKAKKTAEVKAASSEPETVNEAEIVIAPESEIPQAAVEDPIGDTTDGEAEAALETEAEGETEVEAEEVSESKPETEDKPEVEAEGESESETEDKSEDDEAEDESKPKPPVKLERLQKILAQAGVASRRHAEEMIEQGRVQINGKVVTVLGTKADAGRDHIRVDGKLLQGAERLRYFVLNKPKGFVTTAMDPEGRPTVMQFFEKMKERLYPVGRLDYMSEGLLVVTNDGELANRLTKASSGVEKTYLVKVAGQPTEAELNTLRGGVAIERGKPGSGQVRTSPARIRQVRQGDNPWYEVILIEGRNRELRKMFEEVGHFVEKIRRIGYGPLVLDQEPGSLRELEPKELDALRRAAEGTLRTPKAKDLRRRNAADAGLLPTVRPKPSSHPRPAKPLNEKFFADDAATSSAPRTFAPKKTFGADRPRRTDAGPARFASARPTSRPTDRTDRPTRPYVRPDARPASRPDDRPARPFSPSAARPAARPYDRSAARPTGRPAWKKDDRPARSHDASEGTGRSGAGRPFAAKPAWKRPEHQDRPAYNRPPSPRREEFVSDEDFGPIKPPNLHIEEIHESDRPTFSRPPSGRSSAPRSYSDRPQTSRPSSNRPSSNRPSPSRSNFDRPASSARSGTGRPFQSKSGLARPFTTSSGVPRAGGARPSSKPGKTYGSGARSGAGSRPSYGAKRPYGDRPSGGRSFGGASKPGFGSRSAGPSKPYAPRTEGASDYRPTKAKPYPSSSSRAERKAGPDWKSKPSFGGPRKPSFGGSNRPASGDRSKPRPGGFSKSGYKGKPSGGKRMGFRPGGKKRG
jgi:23S rRNA pseudouridine2605 synthase